MTKPAVQFHVFQGSLDSHPELLRRVADIGFEGVEFAWRLFDFDPEQVGRTLDRSDLSVVGRHVSPTELNETSAERFSDYRRLQCNRLIATHFDEDWFADKESIDHLLTYLDEQADRLAQYDIELSYHNNGAENVVFDDGQTGLEVLFAGLGDDIGFELDVGHALDGEEDPVELLEQHANRINAVHFCDTVPGVDHSIALGKGNVDLDGVLTTAVHHDIEWIVYEGPHHNTTLEEGYERIQSTLEQDVLKNEFQ